MSQRQYWLVPVVLLGFVLAIPPATASPNGGDKAPPVSRVTYQHLELVQKLLSERKFSEALIKLNAALSGVKSSAYETALLLSAQASAYIGQGNYARAATSMERALASEGLPSERAHRAEYDLARLYMALERYKKASRVLAAWLEKHPEPPVEAYVLLGQAYVQRARWQQAIAPLRKAIRISSAPKESWYQLLLAAYYESKDYRSCKRLLKVMVKRWPGEIDYWRQLAGIHQSTGEYKQALAVLEMAYLRSLLRTEDDLRNLGTLYLQQDQPDRAARVLRKALDEKLLPSKASYYKLLGDSLYLARDRKAATVALRRAAELSNDGQTWLHLAQVAAIDAQWSDVISAARKALQAKGAHNPGRVHLLLGIAHAERDYKTAAIKALTTAAKYPQTRMQAEGWLAYLREDERIAELAVEER